MKEITGQEFVGQITTGRSLKDEYGWVDIIAVENDFWERPRGPCGAAGVGLTEGIALINVERLDACDLYPLAMHEVGHALGFFHVLNLGRLHDVPPPDRDSSGVQRGRAVSRAARLGTGARGALHPGSPKNIVLNPHDPGYPLYPRGAREPPVERDGPMSVALGG